MLLQYHIASLAHYDFRLEWRGTLLSWAIPKGSSFNPADRRLAVRVEGHDLDYRNFEGVIPAGYGAGTVMLWGRVLAADRQRRGRLEKRLSQIHHSRRTH